VCFISSHAFEQRGHELLLMICLFSKGPRHRRMPCKLFQAKIFILARVLHFHNSSQTG
jgi:hypothetical protein